MHRAAECRASMRDLPAVDKMPGLAGVLWMMPLPRETGAVQQLWCRPAEGDARPPTWHLDTVPWVRRFPDSATCMLVPS